MSLSKRLAGSVVVLLACTGLIGAAALFGMWGMRRHFETAAQQYEQLRSVYEIGHRAAMIRQELSGAAPSRAVVERGLDEAQAELGRLRAAPSMRAGAGDDGAGTAGSLAAIARRLDDARAALREPVDLRGASNEVNATLGHVAALAATVQAQIVANREAAVLKLYGTMRSMGWLFAVTVVCGLVASLVQYDSIMRPVRSLNHAVRQLSRADRSHRIRERGPAEFRALIRRFNGMGDEIARLHGAMQRDIDAKSRQLVRSEQLAGVGHLAAGLAHEINNPLGIIAGYAESTRKRLGDADGPLAPRERARVADALDLISDEAFRCRDITRDLLEMARPSAAAPTAVDLAATVERAVQLLRGLPLARDRAVAVHRDADAGAIVVRGDEAQLVQVLINLVANALEACPAGTGQVAVAIERRDDAAVVTVTDNGGGMDEHTLRHAFDPFFTDKARRGLSGTGLGLSVSHAIAERHGGRLDARSDGPGRGSTFTLELPLAVPAEERLHACA